MSTYMRQVTAEEFEVLTRFHPGEVRYYVDTSKPLNRKQGAKVTVKKASRVSTNTLTGQAAAGQHVQLTTKEMKSSPGTLKYKVYRTAVNILQSDPTQVLLRSELTDKLAAALPHCDKKSQVVPTISGMIKTGELRYVGS